MQSKRKEIKGIYPWLFLMFFYLVIARLLILSGDDWAWGGQEGLNRLKRGFDNYNGRYAGNLIEILITRSIFARCILYSLVNTSIVYLIWLISEKKVRISIIALLLLLMPVEIYKQTYGWLAGFSNYNVSTFLLLLLFYMIKKNKLTLKSTLLVFLISFLLQFFAENVTLVSVVLSFIVLSIYLIQKKNLILPLSWLIGSLIGFFTMFSNSAYHSDDNMRSLSNADFSELLGTIIGPWLELLFKNNLILFLAFLFIMYFISKFQIIKKSDYFIWINLFIVLYFILRYSLGINYNYEPHYLLLIEGVFILFFIITLIYLVFISDIHIQNKLLFTFFFFSGILFAGPFIAVTPFGPRNVLTSYILFILAFLQLYLIIPRDMAKKYEKLAFVSAISIALIFVGLHSINKYEENKRISYIKDEFKKGSKEIRLERLPFEFLGHDLTPKNGNVQSDRQKRYHKISEDVDFKVINHTENKKEKQ